ncbi:sialidase family protein [Sphingomonas sp. PB2P12]|uniref:sialidase family protein n=1 Tax=Sphingomonas sandaracina TaxID=3096157 RepID=UPI002FC95276
MKAAIIGLAAMLSGAGAPENAPQSSASDALLKAELIDAHAPYPQAHASTIVQLGDGSLMAAWFGGSGEGNADVRIWTSRNAGGVGDGWTAPKPVANGIGPDGRRFPTWNPVLFQPAPGDLRLFYKVGPNPRDWWGMMIRSADNGRSWSKPERLPDGVLGPIKNKPVVLRDGSWLAPSSREEGSAKSNRWSLHMELSTDRGAHWTVEPPIPSPMHIEAIQPSVLSYPDGRLELIARTRQGALAMSWSKDTGRTWSPLAAIDLPNPNAGTDAVTLRDGRQLIVYNHSGHWPDRPGDGPRWPLNLAVSDDGVRWHQVLTLESKPLPDGYAYPAVIQTRDGLVRITYTYDRKRIKYVVVDPRRLR